MRHILMIAFLVSTTGATGSAQNVRLDPDQNRQVPVAHEAATLQQELDQPPQGAATRALNNEDVIRMVRAQLSPNIVIAAIDSANLNFDLSPTGLIGLKQAGVEDRIIEAMQVRVRTRATGATTDVTRTAPEKSQLLATSKDPEFILRSFKTMLVDASRAAYFETDQMKAALGRNEEFARLKITIVDDPAVADVVLDVAYTFAWDYPFTVRHQNTSVVLVSGKGSGPLSGPRGATSVASELVKALRPFRIAVPQPGARKPEGGTKKPAINFGRRGQPMPHQDGARPGLMF